MLFCTAKSSDVNVLMSCVEKYCAWSEQSVSRDKSGTFVSKGVHGQFIRQVKNQWGINELLKGAKCLGMPLFFSPNKTKDLSFVKEKLEAQISGWKCRSLSRMGRTTLIKSVAQSIPLYGMASVKFPRGLCKKNGFINSQILVESQQKWQSALHTCGMVRFVQTSIC